ncbi:MAG: ABC transporter permease [Gemmatimonadetes bacterium]|nr:ABC transporter permease [Gemmatimonadota bacterium]
MEGLRQDLRVAMRRLLKRPGFTIIAIVSVGIGIGANTAIFSLVNAIAVRKVPLDRPGELVDVYKSMAGFTHGPVSFPDLRDLEQQTGDAFSAVAAYRLAIAQVDRDGTFEPITGELVTGNYFTMLGLRPTLGRTLLPSDDVAPGAHPVVVISHEYWQRSYGSDPRVVGQTIRLNAQPYTIVGVGPREYRGGLRVMSPGFYASRMMVDQLNPAVRNDLERRGNNSVFVKARLKPGVSLVQATNVLDRLARSLRASYPDQWGSENSLPLVASADVIMNPMIDRVLVPAAALMMVVVGLVLLIACANLASFLLAQAADRRREVAVRLALGAGRGRLVRQFLTETVLLSALGGATGLALAVVLLKALVNADLPLPLPISLDLSLDPLVLGFSLALTGIAGFAFGLAPALQATRPDVASTIKDESVGAGRGRAVSLRGSLVVVQVAVSLVLLVGSALFLRSFRARLDIDPGFGSAPAVVAQLQVPTTSRTLEQARIFFEQLSTQLAAIPGVVSVGLTDDLQLSALNNQTAVVTVPGIDPPPGRPGHGVDHARVTPGFFDAAAVRVVEGRAIDESDRSDGNPVAIVSEAFVRKFMPGGSAIGRTFRTGERELTIVGVAADSKIRALGEDPVPFLYLAFAQSSISGMTIVARTQGRAEAMIPAVLEVARKLDPDVIVMEAKTMERHLAGSLLPHRLGAWVISAFGTLALLLASIGLFGVVSYAVSTRSREVGIRMALGANAEQVVRLMMGGGMRLVGIGAVLGLALSAAAARLLSGVLYGVNASDPLAFVVAPAVLIGVAIAAAWIPARRVTRINPVRAIRAD